MSPTESSKLDILNAYNNVDTEEVSNEAVVRDASKFRRLYVEGLPLTTTENDVRTYFTKWGAIDECFLTKSSTTLFCYLTFVFSTSVDAAQANRPHRLGHANMQTRRILSDDHPFKKLYVGGMKGGTTTGHVFAGFSRFGRVRAVDMIKDKHTGRCRGFCFVTFDDYDSADKCLLNLPIVLNLKVVRIQKAIPVSEMIKVSEECENYENEPSNLSSDQKSQIFQTEARKSISSTDSGISVTNSTHENPFDLDPRRDYSTSQNPFGFSNNYKNCYANDTGFRFYPTFQPDNCCYSSCNPSIPNLLATQMNLCPNYFVSYSNNPAFRDIRCPIYPDSFVPNSIPLNLKYNVACSNMSNSNACFPFVFKNNQRVHYSQLPAVPMIHPVSMMCNYARPGFVGPYQNTFT